MQTEFITDKEIYERVIRETVSSAREFLWPGKRCVGSQRKEFCTDYKDLMLIQ